MSAPLLFPSLLKNSSNCRTSSPIWLSGLEFAARFLLFGLHLEVNVLYEIIDQDLAGDYLNSGWTTYAMLNSVKYRDSISLSMQS